MWRSQLEAFADRQPVVADVARDADTIEAMASLLLERHAGPLLLCGASMGGIIAMEAVRQAPARIRGLALLGTNARPETPDMHALRAAAIEQFRQGRVREIIEPNVALAFHGGTQADPALIASYLDFVLGAGAEQLIRQNLAIMARPDARPSLSAIRCPTLVMCGENDALTPPECSREIAALIQGARLALIAHCGHMLTMEQPARVNAALGEWLRSLE